MTKQESLEKLKTQLIDIVNKIKVEDNPNFIFILSDDNRDDKLLIARCSPPFMLSMAQKLIQLAAEEVRNNIIDDFLKTNSN